MRGVAADGREIAFKQLVVAVLAGTLDSARCRSAHTPANSPTTRVTAGESPADGSPSGDSASSALLGPPSGPTQVS